MATKASVSTKVYAGGKAFAWMEGSPAWEEAAQASLDLSITFEAVLIEERFRNVMRLRGAPEAAIQAYVDSIRLGQEAWGVAAVDGFKPL